MAVDYYLEIEGIPGESVEKGFKDYIDVESFSWGVTQSGTTGSGAGGGAGKATFQDLSFTTRVSRASPNLMIACATGQHIKEATLIARKAGDKAQTFLTIRMEDLLVSSYQTGGSGSDPSADTFPMDSVSLNFARIRFEYRRQLENGTMGPPIEVGYDLKTNKET